MEKRIENLKTEILRILEQDAAIGEMQFHCHQVEIPVCINIENWCRETGLLSEIHICQGDDITDNYAVINIKKGAYKNVVATLFSKHFNQDVAIYNFLIDKHNKILKELKQNKKSITSGNAKVEKKLIELSKSNKQ